MVIRDYHIHPLRHRSINHRGAADAVINRNHQLGAIFAQVIIDCLIRTVTISKAVRNEGLRFGAQRLQSFLHDRRGGQTINVIVPINRDFFLIGNRCLDPGHGFIHIMQVKRIVQPAQIRLAKSVKCRLVRNAALNEEPRQKRRYR